MPDGDVNLTCKCFIEDSDTVGGEKCYSLMMFRVLKKSCTSHVRGVVIGYGKLGHGKPEKFAARLLR